MKAIAIIPARGGSRRIPHKNTRLFMGRPIIEYSIDAARQSNLFESIIVSTDSETTRDLVMKKGCEVVAHPFNRHGVADEIELHDIVKSALTQLVISPDIVCLIYATASLLTSNVLCRAYQVLQRRLLAPYAYSVAGHPAKPNDAGQFYMGRTRDWLLGTPLVTTETIMIPIDPSRVCDIDTEEDFLRAETMYAALCNS